MYCKSMFAEGLKGTLKIVRWPLLGADSLTIFTNRLSCNVAGSTSWKLHSLCRSVLGLLYLYIHQSN